MLPITNTVARAREYVGDAMRGRSAAVDRTWSGLRLRKDPG
jgi:hypothetical protein